MKKRRQHVEQPARPDGSYWWLRLFVPLRGGHFHYEWIIVRIEGVRVRLWGSSCPIPLTAPVLENALWRGPIQPPPLDEPSRTALALEAGGNRQARSNRDQAAADDFTDAERHAMKIRLLAADIVETLFEVGKEVRQGRIRLVELVDRVEELLDDAFGQSEESFRIRRQSDPPNPR